MVVIGVAARAQQQFVFFAALADSAGKPVATLEPDDLKIVENGAEGKVVKIEPIDWPIKLQLLVDNGAGMGEALVQLRNGLKGFVMAMPDGIEMSLITTAPQPRYIVRPTTESQHGHSGRRSHFPDNGAARFVEALNEAAARRRQRKGQLLSRGRHGRLDDR
jgi:hypothetical protein